MISSLQKTLDMFLIDSRCRRFNNVHTDFFLRFPICKGKLRKCLIFTSSVKISISFRDFQFAKDLRKGSFPKERMPRGSRSTLSNLREIPPLKFWMDPLQIARIAQKKGKENHESKSRET